MSSTLAIISDILSDRESKRWLRGVLLLLSLPPVALDLMLGVVRSSVSNPEGGCSTQSLHSNTPMELLELVVGCPLDDSLSGAGYIEMHQ